MNARTKKDFDLYGEAYRIFRELNEGPESLSRQEVEEKWQRIGQIEKELRITEHADVSEIHCES
jgi:hypothetical protein